jgi:hypothetical protein
VSAKAECSILPSEISASKKTRNILIPDCFLQIFLTPRASMCLPVLTKALENGQHHAFHMYDVRYQTSDCGQSLGSCQNFSLELEICFARTEVFRLYPNEAIFALQNSAIYVCPEGKYFQKTGSRISADHRTHGNIISPTSSFPRE